ncbi:hypothetical protein MYX82_14110 [Acidobacteria bacterium AH-259-D05]|nr:hypothetical protein [Acidobacteria bacterium AH-259-D05]
MWHSAILSTFLLVSTTAFAAGNLDLPLLKRNTKIFEGIVNEILKQNFPNPFAVTGAAEGSYLQDYGVVVTFHLNINRATIRTPFGLVGSSKETRPKKEQLRILKDSMVRCLADYGATFKQLTGENSISISAHVEDRNELDSTKNTTIVVISTSKQDVDLLTTGKISFDQFEERVRVVEY